jgi:hypothetical protein
VGLLKPDEYEQYNSGRLILFRLYQRQTNLGVERVEDARIPLEERKAERETANEPPAGGVADAACRVRLETKKGVSQLRVL